VNVRGSSFRPSPTTFFVVLAWLRDESRFHERCLLIPSEKVREFARDDGNGHLMFDFLPGSTSQSGLEKYQQELNELRNLVSGLVSG
jgi:hypothetical protein